MGIKWNWCWWIATKLLSSHPFQKLSSYWTFQTLLGYYWISLQRLFLPLDFLPLSRFFVQCRVSLENSGRISLLECYRTAASVCSKHLYPKESSFKNRTSWNKAGLSYIFFIYMLSLFFFLPILSPWPQNNQWQISLSACVHTKYSKRQDARYFLEQSQ